MLPFCCAGCSAHMKAMKQKDNEGIIKNNHFNDYACLCHIVRDKEVVGDLIVLCPLKVGVESVMLITHVCIPAHMPKMKSTDHGFKPGDASLEPVPSCGLHQAFA